MQHPPQCSGYHYSSGTFCPNEDLLSVESEDQRKTAVGVTIILLAAVIAGVAFGAIRFLQGNFIVSQNNDAPVSEGTAFLTASGSLISQGKTEAFGPGLRTTKQTVQKDVINVLVEYFTSSKNRDYPMPNEPLTLQSGGKSFSITTNSKGFAKFSNIPCGKQVEIMFTGEPKASFSRSLTCQGQLQKWRYHFNSFKEFNSAAIEQIQ